MSIWRPALDLSDGGATPLFARIARSVVDDVLRGRLRAGDALPGSRTLATELGVHRNTVLAAYDALRAEGWVETVAASATRVALTLPVRKPRRFSSSAPVRAGLPEQPHFALGSSPPAREWERPANAVALYGGVPDLRLFPADLFARALRRVLRTQRASVLDYGAPHGHPWLRESLATMVSSLRGVAAREENVLVTRGAQQAVDLCARALVRPGDVVAVESLGYAPSWQALRAAGAELVPVRVDRDGIDIEALEALCARRSVRAVYVTPHHQYPTGACLSPARRLALLRVARTHRIAVIEDDYDHEFHYEGRPVLPLASADPDGAVVYIGTLSKLLAPGLRVGFVVGPSALVELLARHRAHVDRQGDRATEAALATLIDEGELSRHARRARVAYAERRDAFVTALREHAGEGLRFEPPRGGMAVWARIAGARGADALVHEARGRGVLLQSTRGYCYDGRDRPWVRLGFAAHEPRVLRDAARALAAALAATG
jgi:GntR family transcriptional regulator/MocR family aminotransferase